MPTVPRQVGIATEDVTDSPPLVSQYQTFLESGAFPDSWKKKRDPLSRPFVAWDGEGITFPGNTAQSYVLFGNSTGRYVISSSECSLSTKQCFDLMLATEEECPEAIHVGFALQYDANMIFKDLSREMLTRIYRTNVARWNGYRIEYRPGKWLMVSHGGTTIRLFDVFGFFQSSFVKAIGKFLGDTPETAQIIAGKNARRIFEFADLKTSIQPYWEAELRLLVRLMDALRTDLFSAGIEITSWHGPGAVANRVFRTHNIAAHKEPPPLPIVRASQFAYAGGRFELFRCGHYDGPVYEYDINSAYPDAIRRLPSLTNGTWERVADFEPGSFGVWRVSYSDTKRGREFQPHPLFCRNKSGHVTYQDLVLGWYWTPEVEVARCNVLGGYVFRPDGNGRSSPFAFVADMYEQRRQWKRDGNSAERAYKLALNSLYGKMAQRIGWEEGGTIPKWHQLEWAGYITSYTRAKIWKAICQNPAAIIAVETDAVFSTEPLDLTITDQLGDWSYDCFDWITYLQNGVYWAGQDGRTIDRYRGYDKGSLSHEAVMTALHDGTELEGQTTRFIGLGLGLATKSVWRSWETSTRALKFGGGGKRQHLPRLCPVCRSGRAMTDALHPLVLTSTTGRSHPHSLPWLGGIEAELRSIDEREIW